MENLLDALRHETSKLHQTLHVQPLLKSCQEGTMTKEEYIHLLKAFYSPWKFLAIAIDLVPIAVLRPKLKSRMQAIQEDLMKLNVNQSIFKPITPKLKPSQKELLGMSYVLIGSSMGASMLSAKIKESLGDVPVSYLSMSPKEAGWPELVSELRRLESKDYALALTAACSTFKLIKDELSVKSGS